MEDFYREPKILKSHTDGCREIGTEKTPFRSLDQQLRYNKVVAEEFTRAKGTYETGLSIYMRMLTLSRDYAKTELCHIYPPHKKQFVRGVREVRRAARGHQVVTEHEL